MHKATISVDSRFGEEVVSKSISWRGKNIIIKFSRVYSGRCGSSAGMGQYCGYPILPFSLKLPSRWFGRKLICLWEEDAAKKNSKSWCCWLKIIRSYVNSCAVFFSNYRVVEAADGMEDANKLWSICRILLSVTSWCRKRRYRNDAWTACDMTTNTYTYHPAYCQNDDWK